MFTITPVPLPPTPKGLAWRDGAGCIDTEALPAPSHELPGEDLDALIGPHDTAPVHSIAHLLARVRASSDWVHFEKKRAALPDVSTGTLIARIKTSTDPLTAWEIHVQLHSRGIAPCLRWPANTSTPQMLFTTWLADALWFTSRHPTHKAKFQGWQRLLKDEPASSAWCERAYRIFLGMRNQNLSSYGARGLALTHAQREELMVHPTARMVTHRQGIQPAQFEAVRTKLYSHAVAYPDQDPSPDTLPKRTPEQAALQWERLWRVYILSGMSPTATIKNLELLYGTAMKRRMVARRIEGIKTVLAA